MSCSIRGGDGARSPDGPCWAGRLQRRVRRHRLAGWGRGDGLPVYRDGALIATLGADAASYDDTSPDLETYGYQVEAYNGYGSGGSSAKDSESCVN